MIFIQTRKLFSIKNLLICIWCNLHIHDFYSTNVHPYYFVCCCFKFTEHYWHIYFELFYNEQCPFKVSSMSCAYMFLTITRNVVLFVCHLFCSTLSRSAPDDFFRFILISSLSLFLNPFVLFHFSVIPFFKIMFSFWIYVCCIVQFRLW